MIALLLVFASCDAGPIDDVWVDGIEENRVQLEGGSEYIQAVFWMKRPVGWRDRRYYQLLEGPVTASVRFERYGRLTVVRGPLKRSWTPYNVVGREHTNAEYRQRQPWVRYRRK